MKTLDGVEPRIPISGSYTITNPGSYYLTGDLTAAIKVEADNVTIDLMGYSLSGDGSGRGIRMLGRSNVEIRNGTVQKFDIAIHESSEMGKNHRVINVRCLSNTLYGIYLPGKNHLIKNCLAEDNGHSGIFVGSYSQVKGNITANGTQNNLYVQGSGNVIEENLVTGSSGIGIHFESSSNFYANNRASGNTTGYGGNLPTGSGDGGGNVSF
jgi:parallel beta-helix repeat protein